MVSANGNHETIQSDKVLYKKKLINLLIINLSLQLHLAMLKLIKEKLRSLFKRLTTRCCFLGLTLQACVTVSMFQWIRSTEPTQSKESTLSVPQMTRCLFFPLPVKVDGLRLFDLKCLMKWHCDHQNSVLFCSAFDLSADLTTGCLLFLSMFFWDTLSSLH